MRNEMNETEDVGEKAFEDLTIEEIEEVREGRFFQELSCTIQEYEGAMGMQGGEMLVTLKAIVAVRAAAQAAS